MFALSQTLLFAWILLADIAFGYPKGFGSNNALQVRDDKFILAAIGDSWASGVQWSTDTAYDGNEDACMRYKYAWSTVVNASYSDWTPNPDQSPEFEFRACSGAHLGDNIKDQMDKLSRPKMVLLQAGGNDAIFYPMADACLFHANITKDYGTKYQDDNPESPTGECMREISLVRGRVEGNDIRKGVEDTINMWRSHPAVTGNDATLFMLGYARFFALDDACNDWDFGIALQNTTQRQNVVRGIREDFNELVSTMNTAIRTVIEGYQDDKIQYVHIDPAFQGHRFCETGHTKLQQYNWGNNVHIFNNPARWYMIITNGETVTMYEPGSDMAPPEDILNKLWDHRTDEPIKEEEGFSVLNFENPEFPELKMQWYIQPQGSADPNGYVARTLHPTVDGHKDMGNLIVQFVRQHYRPSPVSLAPGQTSTPPPTITLPAPLSPCPAGCTCNGIVPLCT